MWGATGGRLFRLVEAASLGHRNQSQGRVKVKQFSFFRKPTRTKSPASGQQPGTSSARPVSTGTVERRFGLLHVTIFFAIWVAVICGRLVWLQVVHYKDYVDRAAKQQQRTFEVAPRRGVLYDRNLHELAMTVLADSVYAVPSEIADRQDP